MKSVLKHTVVIEPGKYLAPGTEIDLKKADHKRLMEAGALVSSDKPAGAVPAKPKGQALESAVAGAIGRLDPKNPEAWTRDEKPVVAHLERLLGYDITMAERDAGWDAYRQQNPDLFKPAA